MSTEAFFRAGRNCDSVRHADRFSLLIDDSHYLRVLREAITRARRTVFMRGELMTSMHEVRMEDMPGAKSTPSRGIRITTYNVHDAVGLDGKLAPERIAAVLAEIWD
jgi:hypothetical protein